MSIDRITIRSRPAGRPLMHQTWDKLLFLHWPISEHRLRPLVPSRLDIDTYDGTGWIGITPFTIRNLRPHFLPSIPILSSTHELNVRTYVHLDGVPGVWFLSLDASNPLAILGARMGFALPYFLARMSLKETNSEIQFVSRRRHPAAERADIHVKWRTHEKLPEAAPESLDFFLLERYCLYAARGGRLARTRIHHRPWPLKRATVQLLSSTMIESHRLPTPSMEPVLHALAAPIDVDVWAPLRV